MRFYTTSSLLPLLALQSSAATIKSRTPYQVKSSHPIPQQWQKLDRAPEDHMMEMRIGLTQDKFTELERELYEGTEIPPPAWIY